MRYIGVPQVGHLWKIPHIFMRSSGHFHLENDDSVDLEVQPRLKKRWLPDKSGRLIWDSRNGLGVMTCYNQAKLRLKAEMIGLVKSQLFIFYHLEAVFRLTDVLPATS